MKHGYHNSAGKAGKKAAMPGSQSSGSGKRAPMPGAKGAARPGSTGRGHVPRTKKGT